MVTPTGPPPIQTATGHEFKYEIGTAQVESECIRCRQGIKIGELRIGPMSNGVVPLEWHHFDCIFLAPGDPPSHAHDIKGMESLSPNERERVIEKLRALKVTERGKSPKHEGMLVEYSSLMDDECEYCKELISAPGEIRIGLLKWKKNALIPLWHHLFCLFRRQDFDNLGIKNVEQIAGYRRLLPHGRQLVENLILARKRGLLTPGKFGRGEEEEEYIETIRPRMRHMRPHTRIRPETVTRRKRSL